MLAKKYRFHGQRSLKAVFARGDVFKVGHIIVRFQANPRRKFSRAAVVVSKKIAKRAHDRNRLRRRVYEMVRNEWSHLEGAYDLVFIITSPHLNELSAEQLQQEIRRALERVDASSVS